MIRAISRADKFRGILRLLWEGGPAHFTKSNAQTGANVHLGSGCPTQYAAANNTLRWALHPCLVTPKISVSPASLTIGTIMRRIMVQGSRFCVLRVRRRESTQGRQYQDPVCGISLTVPSKLFGRCGAKLRFLMIGEAIDHTIDVRSRRQVER
jgi:hypothetical protein